MMRVLTAILLKSLIARHDSRPGEKTREGERDMQSVCIQSVFVYERMRLGVQVKCGVSGGATPRNAENTTCKEGGG